MSSKTLTVSTTVALVFFASYQLDKVVQVGGRPSALSLMPEEAAPCYRCSDMSIGSYFFEGTEIWIPNEANSPFQPGNTYLSVEVDWDGDSVVFRSSEFKFCGRPPKIWTYASLNLQDLFLYACEPTWISTQVSTDRHELKINLDGEFLLCAFESNMAGFKFAVPVF